MQELEVGRGDRDGEESQGEVVSRGKILLRSPLRQERGQFHWKLWRTLPKMMRIISGEMRSKRKGHELKNDEGVEKQAEANVITLVCGGRMKSKCHRGGRALLRFVSL